MTFKPPGVGEFAPIDGQGLVGSQWGWGRVFSGPGRSAFVCCCVLRLPMRWRKTPWQRKVEERWRQTATRKFGVERHPIPTKVGSGRQYYSELLIRAS